MAAPFVVAILWAVAAMCAGAIAVAAAPATTPAVRINEFLADNDNVIADEHGQYDDVLELFNPGPVAVSLGGMYLTDDLADPSKFRITDGITIPAGGFLLFWADSSPEQGAYHTSFSLSKSGERIGLFDTAANGNAPLDTHTFGPQTTDISEGRCPDGGSTWLFYSAPTLGATNEPCGVPPSIAAAEQVPAFPQAGAAVTVSAGITDDGLIVTATLWYSAGAGYLPIALTPQGADRYQATLPGQPQGVWVRYYLEAEDDAGRRSTDPPGAPAVAYSYVAGYQPSPVILNELMADNTSTLEDPDEPGEYPDWIELHNPGPAPLDLDGLYLTDYLASPAQFRIPDGVTIPAGGFLVFYADGDPGQGPRHADFKLSAGGEALGLYGAGGKVRLDAVQFPAQAADVSYAQQPDGTGGWGASGCPTPGRSNQACYRAWLPLVSRVATAPESPPLPLRLDCGSDAPHTTPGGNRYLADRAWTMTEGFGYLGGYPDALSTEWWADRPVGGTDDAELYKTQRHNWREYRVSAIPNGDYVLTLRFEEQVVHGPGLGVFDVAVEGQTLLDDFDVYAQVGRHYALDRRFAITVADGELNVTATPVSGEPHLAALELVPCSRDSTAPGVPAGLQATASYGAVLLDWADRTESDLAGYHIYRANRPDGPYTRLTAPAPANGSRFQDDAVAAHAVHYYRASAVDVYGNESGQSAYAAAAAIDVSAAVLPLYQVEVSSANLSSLYANPFLDNRVPGAFTWQSETFDVEVRFRGEVSRTYGKKSWKVVFDGDSPFANHDRINVNANWRDASLIRANLANRVFEAAGTHPPQAQQVLLTLNGEFLGVYTQNEQVDEGFLLSSGRNPGASIYKVNGRFAELLPDEAAYRTYYEKETNEELGYKDLIAFIELINDAPDNTFAEQIVQVLDVQAFLDYYAVIVLTGNEDSAAHNTYLVHDLDSGLWEVIPWDLDLTFYRATAPINIGSLENPEMSGSANLLRSRILAAPDLRAQYCRRLAEYMETVFSDARMEVQVNALYGVTYRDGLRDWRKLGWEQADWLTSSPYEIKSFVRARREYLAGVMAGFCP